MRISKKWLFSLVILLSCCCDESALAEDLFEGVCPLPRIKGFDAEYNKAKRVLGNSTTSDIKSCEVFITKKGDYYYFHSNYVGKGAENPTKISHKTLRDLGTILQNIYGITERSSDAEIDSVGEAYERHVKFHIDQTLFDSAGKIDLGLGGAEKLYVLFDGGPPPKLLTRLNPIRGPPSHFAEYHPSLFVKVTHSTAPRQFFTKLEQRPFNLREIRFVSLVADSATETAIKASGVAKIRDILDAPSKELLQKLFVKNAGKVVILLGHVEGENFVAKDATGKTILFTLSLIQLEQLAAMAGCDVVMLGCNSALAETSVGVNNAFNPVDAIGRLDKALKAQNYLEFVRTLSNEDMGLVFADTAFDRTTKRVEAEVYVREPKNSEPVVRDENLVGRVGIVFGIAASSGGSSGGGTGGGDDDKRTGGNGGGGSDGTAPGGVAGAGPANQVANPPGADNTWMYVILVVFLVIVIGGVIYRLHAA